MPSLQLWPMGKGSKGTNRIWVWRCGWKGRPWYYWQIFNPQHGCVQCSKHRLKCIASNFIGRTLLWFRNYQSATGRFILSLCRPLGYRRKDDRAGRCGVYGERLSGLSKRAVDTFLFTTTLCFCSHFIALLYHDRRPGRLDVSQAVSVLVR